MNSEGNGGLMGRAGNRRGRGNDGTIYLFKNIFKKERKGKK